MHVDGRLPIGHMSDSGDLYMSTNLNRNRKFFLTRKRGRPFHTKEKQTEMETSDEDTTIPFVKRSMS